MKLILGIGHIVCEIIFEKPGPRQWPDSIYRNLENSLKELLIPEDAYRTFKNNLYKYSSRSHSRTTDRILKSTKKL
jgi:hypothetical protein